MAWKADRIDAAVIALLEKGRERREAKEGEAGGPGVEDGGMVEWHLIADRPAIRSHPPGAMGRFCGVFLKTKHWPSGNPENWKWLKHHLKRNTDFCWKACKSLFFFSKNIMDFLGCVLVLNQNN